MTKYSEFQILNDLLEGERTLVLDLFLWDRIKYGTPLSNLSQAKKIFRSYAKPTMFRSLGGFEAKNQRQVHTVKELYNQGVEQDKKKSRNLFGM